jgi:hypothetical protein
MDATHLTYEMRLMQRALDKSGISITDRDKLKALIESLKDEGLILDRAIEKQRVQGSLTTPPLKSLPHSQGAKYSMGTAIEPLMNSEERYKRITFGIISVILVMVIGLLVFNNRGEFRKVVSNLKPGAVYSKGSKELYGEVNESGKVSAKETAQKSIGKTPEAQPNKADGGGKETLQQTSFQKRYLVVISGMANIRGGPGIDFPIWSVAEKGDVIEKLDDKQEKWMKIKTRDGVVGWISKELLGKISE